ncbi:MAG: glycosyltransferase family 4 protein [Anaerolineae bacterium]
MRIGLDGRYMQDHFPGIGRYTRQMAEALARTAPDDAWVIFWDPTVTNTRFDLAELAALPNVELVPASTGVFSLRQQALMPRLARRHRLDLYHAPYLLASYLLPCPLVATVHDLIPSLFADPARRAAFRGLTRLCLWRAAAVVVDSEATRADLSRFAGERARIATVLPGVDASFAPRPQEEVAALRARLGLAQPYLLYLGTNKPHKNLVRLVEAWAGLPREIQEAHLLVLAGWEDPRYPEARRAVERLGVGARVRFLGAVANSDLPTLLSGATALVFPSLYEGFGLPVLEAMACGAPVACSGTSSLPEVVGDAALTFDPLDVAGICLAMTQLLADEDLRRELALRGLARARTFTWERAARSVLALYGEILADARTQKG